MFLKFGSRRALFSSLFYGDVERKWLLSGTLPTLLALLPGGRWTALERTGKPFMPWLRVAANSLAESRLTDKGEL